MVVRLVQFGRGPVFQNPLFRLGAKDDHKLNILYGQFLDHICYVVEHGTKLDTVLLLPVQIALLGGSRSIEDRFLGDELRVVQQRQVIFELLFLTHPL